MKLFSARSVFSLAALAAASAVPSITTAAEANFAGKRIELTVPFAPGGGSDVYARALAPYFEKYLPGNPTIIVRNIPGARGIPGANQWQSRSKTDGTDAIVVSASTVANYVLTPSKVDYKLKTWEPVLLSPQGAVVYGSPALGVKTPKDFAKLKGQQLVFGGQSAGSAELRVITTFELLGLKPRYVWGMNRGPVRLAFERGEMNINYDSAPGFLKNAAPLVKAGKAVPLYSLGVLNDKGELVRDPNFPDLVTFAEVYEAVHGKKPTGDGYDAWLGVMKMLVMLNKGVFLPAGTPKPVLDAWRDAARKILEDAEFQKTAGNIIEGYPQFVGEAAKPIIKDATTFTPPAWKWIQNYLKTEHNVTVQ